MNIAVIKKMYFVLKCILWIEIDVGIVFFLQGHSAEIISMAFNTTGNQLITGSFDHTVSVWDVTNGK